MKSVVYIFTLIAVMVVLSACGGGSGSDSGDYNAPSWRLAKTGSTVSVTDYDDGYYRIGADFDFTRDDTAQIVTDNVNGAMWQDDEAVETNSFTWTEAVDYCENLELGGYDDWELPKFEELTSLINYNTNKIAPAFIYNSGVWSSSTTSDDSAAWTYGVYTKSWEPSMGMSLSSGPYDVNTTLFVRCVRGDRYPDNGFIRNDEESLIYDSATGLYWQDDAEVNNDGLMKWGEAISYCESLTKGGYNDWRLPNIRELESIFDKSLSSENTTYPEFQNISDGKYWSSSADIGEHITVILIIFVKNIVTQGDSEGNLFYYYTRIFADLDHSQIIDEDLGSLEGYDTAYTRCVRGGLD